MKKKSIKAVLAISALILAASAVLSVFNYLEEWICALIIVLSFPVFVISLGMYCKESDKDGDYPFIGY
ncbi:MAG: hypothetical protein PHO78_05875 [Methanomicrobium sp.]|nr:hypothetical protein [Methanomicrobium sp.]